MNLLSVGHRMVFTLRLLMMVVIWTYLLVITGSAYLAATGLVQSSHNSICCSTPAEFGLDYSSAQLSTSDGLALKGWYIPSRNGAAVILLHGYGANRLAMLTHAQMLASNDYGVLLYDQRASGESEGKVRSWGWADIEDVSTALAFVQQQPDVLPGRIGVLGCSIGGQIAIQAAARQPELRAVIADAPTYSRAADLILPDHPKDRILWPVYPLLLQFIEWRSGVPAPEPLLEAVQQIAPRSLLIISTGQEMEMLQAQHYYERAGQPKAWWNISDGQHCSGQESHPQQYEQTIVQFFDKAFLEKE
jgi:pimeloyl-ACP methyl ester carboxylesterase